MALMGSKVQIYVEDIYIPQYYIIVTIAELLEDIEEMLVVKITCIWKYVVHANM